MTDPLYVLAHAVETAQRTASEIVAEAIRAAETAGYERGVREAPKAPAAPAAAAPSDALRALLAKVTELVAEAEGTGSSIDGLCDDLTVGAKKRGRRTQTIAVPDSSDSFSDVATFMDDYGGKELVDPDDIEIDADEVRNVASNLADTLAQINDALDALRALLTPAAATEGETEGETQSKRSKLMSDSPHEGEV